MPERDAKLGHIVAVEGGIADVRFEGALPPRSSGLSTSMALIPVSKISPSTRRRDRRTGSHRIGRRF